jgi:hypothetical protein
VATGLLIPSIIIGIAWYGHLARKEEERIAALDDEVARIVSRAEKAYDAGSLPEARRLVSEALQMEDATNLERADGLEAKINERETKAREEELARERRRRESGAEKQRQQEEQQRQDSELDVQSLRDAWRTLTSTQWKQHIRGLDDGVGARVRGTGWVVDVTDAAFGGRLAVYVDLDEPSGGSSEVDVYVPVPRSQALGLKRGEKVSFTGHIMKLTSNGRFFLALQGAVLE